MSTKKSTTNVGSSSAKQMKAAAATDEKKIEKQKGGDLKKGPDRLMERAMSAKRPAS